MFGRRYLLAQMLSFLPLIGSVLLIGMSSTEVIGDDTYIQVKHPKRLNVDRLSAERIAVGVAGDYKPCIVRLPNDELLLAGFAGEHLLDEYVFFYRSRDGGKTWSQREYRDLLGREPYLSIVSDGTLFISTHVLPAARGNTEGYTYWYLYRSADGGRTWQWIKVPFDEVLRTTRKDGQRVEKAGVGTSRNVIELQDGTLAYGVGAPHGSVVLWRSTDRGRSWDKTLTGQYGPPDIAKYPYSIHNEAFLWQARAGDLLSVKRVASKFYPALRGTQIPRSQVDHFERMVLYRSTDGGRNWSYEELGSYYGEMYPAILRLDDGRLLFTFTVRAIVAPQQPPLGVQGVLGVETAHGFKFDFQHDRIMLDTKTPPEMASGGGFGPTVQLGDGTLVTSYSYRDANKKTYCEIVRWRLPD